MQIRVLETPEVENKGKYNAITVQYDQDGETKKKMLVSFGEGESVYKTLVRAKPGEAFDIKAKKDGKYWNWVDATAVEGDAAPSTTGGTTRQSGWRPDPERETRDERNIKQVMIVRQSSLSNAVEYHKLKGEGTLDDVLRTSRFMEEYVLGAMKLPEID